MHYVFAYGTLRKHQSRAAALDTSRLVGTATTQGRLYIDRYPVLTDGDSTVVGELYAVDDETLRTLDAIEGHPHFYERQEIEVNLDGDRVTAYAYKRPPEDDAEPIPSGDFVAYTRRGAPGS